MAGEIDFDQALIERVALLKDLPESLLLDVLTDITFSPGAITLISRLRERKFKVGAVSGGFINVLEPLLHDLDLDFLQANKLEICDSRLTGNVEGPIVNREMKRTALLQFAHDCGIAAEEVVAVGDGAIDLLMIQAAGLGVSYVGKPILNQAADVVLSEPGLDVLLNYI